ERSEQTLCELCVSAVKRDSDISPRRCGERREEGVEQTLSELCASAVNTPSLETPSLSPKLRSKTYPFDKLRAGSERSRRIQNLKWAGIVAIGVTFALCGAVAEAQQSPKVPRIGFLSSLSAAAVSARMDAFRQGLRDLGYVEGKK